MCEGVCVWLWLKRGCVCGEREGGGGGLQLSYELLMAI